MSEALVATMTSDAWSSICGMFGRAKSAAVASDMRSAAASVMEETDRLTDTFDGISAEAKEREVDPLALLIRRVKSSRLRRDLLNGY